MKNDDGEARAVEAEVEVMKQRQSEEDQLIVNLTRQLDTCKKETECMAQECVEMGSEKRQCERRMSEIQAEVAVLQTNYATISSQHEQDTTTVNELKKQYALHRSVLMKMAPGCKVESDKLVKQMSELMTRPKELALELKKIQRHKHDLEQQILLQQKNIQALAKLSSGQSSRVEVLERDIIELEAVLMDTEERNLSLKQSYQAIMSDIQNYRDHEIKTKKNTNSRRKQSAPSSSNAAMQNHSPHPATPKKSRRDGAKKNIQTAADLIESFQKWRYNTAGSKRQKTLLEY
ncbi:Aste57867_18760 [Aphanomyces stellatus]|uniref:Aste57867_18760 protein n=1 Tax=Aphanomyces stellatus TaxID=120398 RepID=A0A485LB60_9STRA|nr:hypothetical protein As57867_018696 [Aphanomyces stellatus]VFT95494.1 Aste57867_18760 [Aphanomyces stellatus]